MNHVKKSLAAALLVLTLIFALTACGESEQSNYDGPAYVDYEIGDLIYDDGSVSFSITALADNESGGYTMTVFATNNDSKSNLIISFVPYDTEEYNEYIEQVQDGKKASVSQAENGVTFYMEMDEESENFTGDFEWNEKYIYYGVTIVRTNEEVTQKNVQELLESEDSEIVLETRLKIDVSSIARTSEESRSDEPSESDSE